MEVLPRGMLEGQLLTTVDHVLGVSGGFVVGGRVGPHLVAIHYDFPRRTVTSYWIGPYDHYRGANWFYFRELHALVVAAPAIVSANAAAFYRGVDLTTGRRNYQAAAESADNSRLAEAIAEVSNYTLPAPYLPVVTDPPPEWPRGPYLHFDRQTSSIIPHNLGPEWESFTPETDGRPLLENCQIVQAQCRGNVLALLTRHNKLTLRLFRGPDGTPLAEYSSDGRFALSGDGRLLARPVEPTQLEVRDSTHNSVPRLVTIKGKAHQRLHVRLGKRLMTVRVGKYGHLFNWHRDDLKILTMGRAANAANDKTFRVLQTCGTLATGGPLPRSVQYDRKRFVLAATEDVVVVSDAFGQLAVFDQLGQLVCVFFVFRDQAGAWMPDGTRYGPPSITGGPPTPGALAALGNALREASARAGRSET
jgi:hypothetical protein